MESAIKLGTQKSRFKDVEYPTIYCNMMGIGATAYDITLILGEVESATKDEVVGIPKMKLLLAPEQAQNLLTMVKAVLDQYIKHNGPLRESGRVVMPDLDAALAPTKATKPQ